MTESSTNRPASLSDYLAILRARIWFVVVPVALAPIVAFVLSNGMHAVYQASSSIYIDRTPATATATGIYDQSSSEDPARFFETQAAIARDPRLTAKVARAVGMSPGEFRAQSSVQPSSNADLLIFSVQDPNPDRAATLANAYADAFTKFTPAQDRQTLTAALDTVRAKLASLRAQGTSTTSPVYSDLVSRESQLQTALALESGAAPQVVQPAHGASKISPRPKRDAMLGLALGLVIGIGAAFLAEAIDKRVRSEREIEEILGLPLLARLPAPPKPIREGDDLAILADPRSASAEAVRQLRTNLEFISLNREARVIMVSSSLEQEGKSTTAASLAVALARSGRRVALVDLDLRKPYLHRFFGIPQAPGVTDVVARRQKLDDALKPILVAGTERTLLRPSPYFNGNGEGHGGGEASGLLTILPAGTLRSDPGEFFSNDSVAILLDELRQDWDIVLVDTPPLPAVGDGLAVSASVDAILVVARFGAVSRSMLKELTRLLDASPADVLGFVLTGARGGEMYYGYGHQTIASEPQMPLPIEPRLRKGGPRRSARTQRS